MEDLNLIQAVERYLDGTMLPAEKSYFEELKNNNSEIEQLVIEHSVFINQIENFSSRLKLKNSFSNIHKNLLSLGEINEGQEPTTKSKIINIWQKYKRVTAIAAAVGGGIALLTSSLFSYYNPISPNITKLGAQLEQQQYQITALNNEIRKSKIPSKAEIKGGGTSFLIDGKGYLITNAHVLEGATYASVFSNTGKEYNASIAYRNNLLDLAILKIEDEEFEQIKKLPFGVRKNNAELGDEIFTIGYPNFPRTDVVYNIGYLSSEKGYNGDSLSCQIQMNANHGNSGGPIFNRNGEIIGVLSTKLSKSDGVSFAIKAKNIYSIVEDFNASDTSFADIKINHSNILRGEDRVKQVKKIEDYIFMVKAYRN